MIETLGVLFVVGLSTCIGLLLPLIGAEALIQAGWTLMLAGLLMGLPASLVYHVALRSCLRANGALPRRWWLHPVSHHAELRGTQRPRVLRWFVAGGASFVVTLAGCGVVCVGVVVAGVRAGVF